MRTILLLGVAAGLLLLTNQARAFAQDAQPRLDYGVPSTSDTRVYTGFPDRVPSEVDYRQVGGAYEADGRWTGAWNGASGVEDRRVGGTYDTQGRWTGTWDGTYQAPDGGVYGGRYQGSVASAGTSFAAPPAYYSTGQGAGTAFPQGGYSYGYYSPGVVVTTVTTTEVIETVETSTEPY